MSEHLKNLSFAAAGIATCILFTMIQELIFGEAVIIRSLTASIFFGGGVALLLQKNIPCRPKNVDAIKEQMEQQTIKLLRPNEQLSALYEIGRTITASLQLNVVLNTIARSASELIGSDSGGILLLDYTGKHLRIQGAYGLSDRVLEETCDWMSESISGHVIQQGRAIIVNELPHHQEFRTPLAEAEGLLACASVPLRIGSRIIGTLDVHSKSKHHAFDSTDVSILEMLASQAAIAIENARLYEDLQQSNAELESRVRERTIELENANNRLTREISERKHAEETLAKEHNLLRALIDNLPDNIYVKDQNSRFLVANLTTTHTMGASEPDELIGKTDFDFYPVKIAERFYADELHILESGQPLFNKEESLLNQENGKNEWVQTSKIPFRDAHGRIVGFVGIGHDITEQKYMQDRLKQYNNELELLDRTNGQFQTCTTEEETYKVLMDMCQHAFPQDAGRLYISPVAQHGMKLVCSWGKFIAHSNFITDEIWNLGSVKRPLGESPEQAFVMASFEFEEDRAYLFAPIVVSQELLGLLALCFHRRSGASNDEHYHTWLAAKRSLASRIAGSYALTLSNLRLREKLRIEAIRDPLTGLYNRRYMENAIQHEESRSKRHHTGLGIIMFDVDHFKRFNDTHGHDAGDTVLQSLGELLRKRFRGEDVACRYGGEEFLIILSGASLESTQQRAEDIWRDITGLKIEHQGQFFSITASVGVADLKNHGPSVTKVISAADKALYLAKKGGRNQVVIAPKETPEVVES